MEYWHLSLPFCVFLVQITQSAGSGAYLTALNDSAVVTKGQ